MPTGIEIVQALSGAPPHAAGNFVKYRIPVAVTGREVTDSDSEICSCAETESFRYAA